MDERVFERMLREGKITPKIFCDKPAANKVDGMTEMLLHHVPYDECVVPCTSESAVRRSATSRF